MGFADRIKAFFRRPTLDESVFDDLCDLLVEGDLGAAFAYEIVDELQAKCKKEKVGDADTARSMLRELLLPYARGKDFSIEKDRLNIVMLLGVNGVGKTTSCAKLANWSLRLRPPAKVMLAAGDTFRAAAVNQLKIHGERLGVRVVAQHQGADSAAVLWDSIDAAKSEGANLVIADTAGRMHTRNDLVKELEKMDRIVLQRAPEANYRRILVLDATTGQNCMRQAEIFCSAVKIDGLILSKYDSSAKGGLVLSLARQLGLEVMFLGTGESYGDFRPFDPGEFLDDFLGA